MTRYVVWMRLFRSCLQHVVHLVRLRLLQRRKHHSVVSVGVLLDSLYRNACKQLLKRQRRYAYPYYLPIFIKPKITSAKTGSDLPLSSQKFLLFWPSSNKTRTSHKSIITSNFNFSKKQIYLQACRISVTVSNAALSTESKPNSRSRLQTVMFKYFLRTFWVCPSIFSIFYFVYISTTCMSLTS